MRVPHQRGLVGCCRRLVDAIVGRACRYAWGRALFGARGGKVTIEVLESPAGSPRSLEPVPSGTFVAIAHAAGRVVGHVAVWKQWERPDVGVPGWWLTGLHVAPAWRGQSIGVRLVDRVIREWRDAVPSEDLYLVVHRWNRPAIRLFERVGFEPWPNPAWEERLARVYGRRRRGRWAYQIMRRACS